MGLVGFVINAGLLLVTAAIASAAKFDLQVGNCDGRSREDGRSGDRRGADNVDVRSKSWIARWTSSWKSAAGCWPRRTSGGRKLDPVKATKTGPVANARRPSAPSPSDPVGRPKGPALGPAGRLGSSPRRSLIIGVFFLLPIAASLALSLTDFDIYALADWRNLRVVWPRQLRASFAHAPFWTSPWSTRSTSWPSAGRSRSRRRWGAALLLESKLTRFKTLWRTIFFAPVVTTLVAAAVVWRYLYHTKYGLFNHALARSAAARAQPIGPIDWMGDPRWAMPAIILLAVWKNFGYNMVIFMAGLQSIPAELYEAAEVDGARPCAAVLARHAADARADVSVRRRHDDDRLLPALRRAVRDDARRARATAPTAW